MSELTNLNVMNRTSVPCAICMTDLNKMSGISCQMSVGARDSRIMTQIPDWPQYSYGWQQPGGTVRIQQVAPSQASHFTNLVHNSDTSKCIWTQKKTCLTDPSKHIHTMYPGQANNLSIEHFIFYISNSREKKFR